jgi:hypothetical protein
MQQLSPEGPRCRRHRSCRLTASLVVCTAGEGRPARRGSRQQPPDGPHVSPQPGRDAGRRAFGHDPPVGNHHRPGGLRVSGIWGGGTLPLFARSADPCEHAAAAAAAAAAPLLRLLRLLPPSFRCGSGCQRLLLLLLLKLPRPVAAVCGCCMWCGRAGNHSGAGTGWFYRHTESPCTYGTTVTLLIAACCAAAVLLMTAC